MIKLKLNNTIYTLNNWNSSSGYSCRFLSKKDKNYDILTKKTLSCWLPQVRILSASFNHWYSMFGFNEEIYKEFKVLEKSIQGDHKLYKTVKEAKSACDDLIKASIYFPAFI
jgi:hypothetical protein